MSKLRELPIKKEFELMNKKFTLYLDESGDFTTKSRPWIIGGLLIGESFSGAEKVMTKVFKDFIRKYNFDSIEDFHLTEIRERYRNDHARVNEFIEDFFDALDGLNIPYCFLTTNNKTKVSAKEPERTYRLMVLDLLLQAETAVVEKFNTDIERLDLVIATRTINGVKQTTSGEIYQEVLQSLPKGLESDLVATGQLALLGSNLNLRMENAKRFWGLINADFICNLTYNQVHEESHQLVSKLKSAKKLYAFDTFSSPELRKIMAQEHNQNYSSAVFNCLRLLDRSPKNKDYQEAILRILDKALNKSGTTGSLINFDSILERIWRSKNFYGKYGEKVTLLQILKSYLENLDSISSVRHIKALRFKLNNLILLAYNHTAEVNDAVDIISEQEIAVAELASSPEHFSMLLDFYVRETEIFVNSLDFESAESQARQHNRLIGEYQSIWELISPELTDEGFLSSDLSVRARSLLLRALLLNYHPSKDEEITSLVEELKTDAISAQDISRIHCQELIFLMKKKKLDRALELAIDKLPPSFDRFTIFDYYFFIFTLNQNLLYVDEDERLRLLNEHEAVVERISAGVDTYPNYPSNLLLRELSLYFYLKGEKKRPVELLQKSNQHTLNPNSPVTKLLDVGNELQLDVIQDKQLSKKAYIEKYKSIVGFDEAIKHATDDTVLYNLRSFFVS